MDATTDLNLEKSEYFCQVCGEHFQDDVFLMAHELLHDKTSFCVLCKRQYLPENYKTHVMDNHMNLACTVCGKAYLRKNSLASHLETHTGRRFPCKKCDKSYAQLWHLNAHMANIHRDHGVRFQCEKCPKDFASKLNFVKHIREIHQKNSASKRSGCFEHKQSASLCGVCGAKFKNSSYLQEHLIKFHFNTELCTYCDQAFDKFLLQKHIDRYHGVKICAKCGETFFDKISLICHLKTHSTASVYCQICFQTYSKDDIDDHMQKHKETKFEKCGICHSSTLNNDRTR